MLRLCYDPTTGSAELSVNYTEFRHTFTLPADKEYVYGATFCNNHSLTIVHDLHQTRPKDAKPVPYTSTLQGKTGGGAADTLSIPYAIYLDYTSALAVLSNTHPAHHRLASSSLSARLDSINGGTALSTAMTTSLGRSNEASAAMMPMTMQAMLKVRAHAIRRYNKESERVMKELKLRYVSL